MYSSYADTCYINVGLRKARDAVVPFAWLQLAHTRCKSSGDTPNAVWQRHTTCGEPAHGVHAAPARTAVQHVCSTFAGN